MPSFDRSNQQRKSNNVLAKECCLWRESILSMLSLNQEPITWGVHLHCIRDPTYAQIQLFLDVFPANFCSYMPEINAEKNGDQSAKRSPASFVRFPQLVSLSALISVICGPQRRQTFAGNNSKNSSIQAQVVSQTQYGR